MLAEDPSTLGLSQDLSTSWLDKVFQTDSMLNQHIHHSVSGSSHNWGCSPVFKDFHRMGSLYFSFRFPFQYLVKQAQRLWGRLVLPALFLASGKLCVFLNLEEPWWSLEPGQESADPLHPGFFLCYRGESGWGSGWGTWSHSRRAMRLAVWDRAGPGRPCWSAHGKPEEPCLSWGCSCLLELELIVHKDLSKYQ